MNKDLADDERTAIESLKRLANKWPKTLWLFSANGKLCVMRKDAHGEKARDGEGFDQNSIIAWIDIENDGGDW